MPRCKADFIASPVSFFWTCHILGPEKRSKHWPPARISLERLKRLSARRESFFLPGLKPLDAEQGLWVAMAEHFEGIKSKRTRFAVVDYETTISVYHDQSCHHVRYDIDYTACHAHAYPITSDELKRDVVIKLSMVGFEFTP